MSAEVCLHFAATFLSYFLRVTAAFIACWMLNRLLAKPRQRFIVWMVFLVGSAAYWLELVVSEIKVLVAGTAGVANAPVSASAIKHSFLLPLAWSHNTLITIQCLGAIYVAVSLSLIGMAVWKHVRMRLLLRHTNRRLPSTECAFPRYLSRHASIAIANFPNQAAGAAGTGVASHCRLVDPRILLPEVCEQIGPTPQVADVLCHELVHVARRDYLWAGLSDLICCLLFFHPAAWQASKAMALQGELACDQKVLEKRPGDRADYAGSLTYFVRLRMLQEGFSLGVDFAASTSLGLRIRTILTTPQPVAWWKACSRAIAGLSLIMAFSVLVPLMALSMGFTASLAEHVSNQPPVQTASGHSSKPRQIQRRAAAQQAPKDSLTTLRVRPYVSETPAYTMTSSSSPVVGSAGSEAESPAWRESQPAIQHPSVSDVIRTTLGEIAARGTRPGRDHDRDDH